MEIIFTDYFLARIEDISLFIALDNPPMAVRWAEEVYDHCYQLVHHPYSGREVPEINRPEIRELIHGNYRLVYAIGVDHIQMLAIFHVRQRRSEEFDF